MSDLARCSRTDCSVASRCQRADHSAISTRQSWIRPLQTGTSCPFFVHRPAALHAERSAQS